MKLTWNPPKHTTLKTHYEWGVDYADEVHNSAVNVGGTTGKPARPWVYTAVDNYINVPKTMQDFLQNNDLKTAFTKTSHALSDAFDDAIEASIYSYPGTTYRTNGEVVTSPRNIVDTGALKDSLSYTIE